MQTVTEGMARVARVADQVGLKAFAREAGVPVSTVRSYRDRGWDQQHLHTYEKLVAAAERLEKAPASAPGG